MRAVRPELSSIARYREAFEAPEETPPGYAETAKRGEPVRAAV